MTDQTAVGDATAVSGPVDTDSAPGADPTDPPVEPCTVLVYSDDPRVREQMRLAIGRHPAPDLDVAFVEAATSDEVIRLVDQVGDTMVDLVVLDGEAAPAGGVGIARQLRDEVSHCPPIVLVIARAADQWLASYAGVDATLPHPLDPILTARTVADLL